MSLVEPLPGEAAEVVVGALIAQAPVVSEGRQTWLCDVVCKRKDDVVVGDRRWSRRPEAIAETRLQTLRIGRIDLAGVNRVLRRVSPNGLDCRRVIGM
jgi:hypothetical protein